MEMFKILGTALIGTAVCLLLYQYKPEFSLCAAVATAAVIMLFSLKLMAPVAALIEDLMKTANLNSEYSRAIIKSLGICYVTKLASDSCNDFNQTAIASKVELAGKLLIICVSLPLLESLTKTALSLIG